MSRRMARRLIILLVVLVPIGLVASGWLAFFKLFAGRLSPPARTATTFFKLIKDGDNSGVAELLAPGGGTVEDDSSSGRIVFRALRDDKGKAFLPRQTYTFHDLRNGYVVTDTELYPRFRTARDLLVVNTSKGMLCLVQADGRWYVRYLYRSGTRHR